MVHAPVHAGMPACIRCAGACSCDTSVAHVCETSVRPRVLFVRVPGPAIAWAERTHSLRKEQKQNENTSESTRLASSHWKDCQAGTRQSMYLCGKPASGQMSARSSSQPPPQTVNKCKAVVLAAPPNMRQNSARIDPLAPQPLSSPVCLPLCSLGRA